MSGNQIERRVMKLTKLTVQTHLAAVGIGMLLGAMFKGLFIIGVVLAIVGAACYAYLKFKK